MKINNCYQSSPTWVKAAASVSAVALAVTSVALATLLYLNPHMGIVSFSLLAGGEGLALLTASVAFHLFTKNRPPLQIAEPEVEARPEIHEEPPQAVTETESLLYCLRKNPELLRNLINAVETFFTTFLSQYYISDGKQPDEKEIEDIRQSFQELSRIANELLETGQPLFPEAETFRQKFLDVLIDVLLQISTAYQKDGYVNKNSEKIRSATSAPLLVLTMIKPQILKLPLEEKYNQALALCVEKLFYSFANPFFYATVGKKLFRRDLHSFRIALERHINESNIAQLQLPGSNDWADYVPFLTGLIERFTSDLHALNFQ